MNHPLTYFDNTRRNSEDLLKRTCFLVVEYLGRAHLVLFLFPPFQASIFAIQNHRLSRQASNIDHHNFFGHSNTEGIHPAFHH